MRFLIGLILVALLVWHFWPEPEPMAVEDTFIGDQVKVLKKAEGFEQSHLDAVKAQQDRMEKQLDPTQDD
ncbi:hypothetical protein F3N42_09985 [Marinihelvus fidelis]|uniref:Uncharacterized protein n=2 Tax=Marinihelvus fidelis TaxID=2613842 RepID=A0A5N0TB26_9GAMM|nr:hypothetical protein F3N42_09985 [Marinihelvus fidelis]